MQIQSDIFAFKVVRAGIQETTALGAAYLAGLAVGFFPSIDHLRSHWSAGREFNPGKEKAYIISVLANWGRALERSKSWLES